MLMSSGIIQELMVAALLGKTVVGQNVIGSRTRRTTTDEMPLILVQSPSERKDSLGRSGSPQFTVMTKVVIIGRIAGLATEDGAAELALQGALNILQGQIERATINDYDLHHAIQNYASIETVAKVSREAEGLLGELVMTFDLEFYQDEDNFHDVETTNIEEFALYADLVNVFSPTDAFDETPFAADAQAAPRTFGPDGRLEGGVLITGLGPTPDPGIGGDLDFSEAENSGLLIVV